MALGPGRGTGPPLRRRRKHRLHRRIPPVGWYSRCTPSERTRQLVVEEGGFLYDADSYNDDLPYYVNVAGHPHLVLPYSFAFNDMRFVFPGFADPMSFFTYLQMGFDELWAEGEDSPKMMTIGLHRRWTGQPGRSLALRKFIEHALGRGQVVRRRADVARLWLEHHPSQEGAAAHAASHYS